MELWDIYDKDRIKTGGEIARGGKFAEGAYHLVVHVCIFNSRGEMLIQLRQPFKENWPGLWDITAGGSALAGESSQAAAERELFEEIGYRADLSGIRPHMTVNFDLGFDDMYLIEADVDISSLILQSDEVAQVRWASREDIIRLIVCGEFIPYHKGFVPLLFSMRKSYGCIVE